MGGFKEAKALKEKSETKITIDSTLAEKRETCINKADIKWKSCYLKKMS